MSSPYTEGLEIDAVSSRDTARLLLRLEGELDAATAAALRGRLREFDDQPLVVDLRGVTFMDSSGLALLLEERARALRHGRGLRVGGATGQTRELLERTGTLRFFDRPTAVD